MFINIFDLNLVIVEFSYLTCNWLKLGLFDMFSYKMIKSDKNKRDCSVN